MKFQILFFGTFFSCLCLLFLPLASQSQNCDATTIEEFFACYGGQSTFTTHSVKAVSTFIQVEDLIKNGQYVQAKTNLDAIFATYPKGSNLWWNVFAEIKGANIGTPHAYYGLRMAEDITEYGLNPDPNVKPKTANMKIVMVGCSEGVIPSTDAELQNGTGQFVKHTIDPKLKENEYRIIKQSLSFFTSYVKAITKGQLDLNIEFVELPDLCLPVAVTTTPPYLSYSGIEPVWGQLTDAAKDTNDWWMILYPSHVPESPAFDDDSFITGGMGADSKGGPVFIADDKWIVRKPAHLGKGNYTDIERRIYLPQWLQHEFFHHLYRIYPELKLEVNGHDWFNQNFWPDDFEGQFETDYYSETLHKRLQKDCAPLSSRLITRKTDETKELLATFTMDELLGPYSLDEVQNPWHEGDIIKEGTKYFWKNKANVKWEVKPDFANGQLMTGNDSPYPGKHFLIELYQNEDGSYLPGAVALKFQGDLYQKRFDLMRGILPIESSLGAYERVPRTNNEHTGKIEKSAGKISWRNDKGDTWSLAPNTVAEQLNHTSDSPTPNQKFALILTEADCGIYTLGFEYLDYYYWKPKRSQTNASPTLVLPTADIELLENFGSYTFSLANTFNDAEGDALMLYVTSDNPAIITAKFVGQELILTGGLVGKSTIYVMAIDANGGLAQDSFDVVVKAPVSSTNDRYIFDDIKISPNPTNDLVNISGLKTPCQISIYSIDNALVLSVSVSTDKASIDLSHLVAGTYVMHIRDNQTGAVKVESVVKN